jgi:hypothetical protein
VLDPTLINRRATIATRADWCSAVSTVAHLNIVSPLVNDVRHIAVVSQQAESEMAESEMAS